MLSHVNVMPHTSSKRTHSIVIVIYLYMYNINVNVIRR